jgi:hypothetical protein
MQMGASGGVGWGAIVENRLPHELCIDLSRARVAVNGGPPRVWPLTGLAVLSADKATSRVLGQPVGHGPHVDAPTVCIPPDQTTRVIAYLDVHAVAGRASLFTVEPTGAGFVAGSAGSRVVFEIPLRQGVETHTLRLQLTAERARDRRVTW